MKKTIFLIVGVMMVLWMSACNGGNDEEVKNENSEATANETDNENTEDITLRFAWWGDQHRTDYTLEVIELFEAQNEGVTIEPEYASWDDYWRKLAPQAAADDLPDIIQMDQSYIDQYSKNKQITDLSPYIDEQINVDNISENVISGGEINDGLYGFNIGSTALGYYYNPGLLDEVGVDDIPENWTWEDYRDIAEAAGEAGYYFGGGVTDAQVGFNHYLRTQGARLFTEDGTGLGYDDDQLFIDYFSMQQELVEIGAGETPDQASQRTGLEDDALVTEEGIGGTGWSTQFMGVQQVADSTLDIAAPPASDSDNGLYLKPSMYFSVAENSEHKEMAAKFLDFFVNDVEANELMLLGDRGIPVSSEVQEELKDNMSEAQQKVFEYMAWVEENSSPMGGIDPSSAGEVIDALQGFAEEIVYGQVEVEDAAESFRNEAESLLNE